MNDPEIERWSRRNHCFEKEKEDKALLQVMNERHRLIRAQWDAPYVELEDPFQRGWVRFYVLSSVAKHRKDVRMLEELLGYLNSKQYSRRFDFCVRHGKSKKWIPQGQKLLRLHVHEILRRKIPDKLFRYLFNFRFESLLDRVNAEQLRRQGYPWKFGVIDYSLYELVIEPHWITHQRVVMPEVEARLCEIEAYLDRCGGWYRYGNIMGQKSWRHFDFEPRLDELRMRQVDKEWREYLATEEGANSEGTVSTVPFSLICLRLLRCCERRLVEPIGLSNTY